MPDELILFLAFGLSVRARSELATRYALRMVAQKLDEPEAIVLTQTLVNAIDPASRFWLRNVLGPRPEAALAEIEGGKTEARTLATA